MTKGRIALLGSAMAMLLCGAGMANAQGYYDGPGYQDGYGRVYEDQPGPASETNLAPGMPYLRPLPPNRNCGRSIPALK